MRFLNGKRCWGAGDREAYVTVICGDKNAIGNIDEPRTCSYTLTLETPAACSEERVQAIKKLLDEDTIAVDGEVHSGGSWF